MNIHLVHLSFCKASRTLRALNRVSNMHSWASKTIVDLSYPLPSKGLNHKNLLRVSELHGFRLAQIDNVGQTANMQFVAKTLLSQVSGNDWILFWDQDNLLEPTSWVEEFMALAGMDKAGYITCRTGIDEHMHHQKDIGMDEVCRELRWAGGWPIGLIRVDVCRNLLPKMIYGSTEWDCLESCLSLGLRGLMSTRVKDLRCDSEQDEAYQAWKAYSIGRKDALGFADWLVRRV